VSRLREGVDNGENVVEGGVGAATSEGARVHERPEVAQLLPGGHAGDDVEHVGLALREPQIGDCAGGVKRQVQRGNVGRAVHREPPACVGKGAIILAAAYSCVNG
jgi:hypothetical protein